MTDRATSEPTAPASQSELSERMSEEVLRLDRELDLAELGLEALQLISHLPRELGQAGGRRGRRRDVGHQSSGIRIQPWRMA